MKLIFNEIREIAFELWYIEGGKNVAIIVGFSAIILSEIIILIKVIQM